MGFPLPRRRRCDRRRAGDRVRKALAVPSACVPLAASGNCSPAPPAVRGRPWQRRRQAHSLRDPRDQPVQDGDGGRAALGYRDGVKKKRAMPKWTPAPQEWIDAFDAALPDTVERRKMFGYPAAFVNGNMAAGLHRDDLVLKLDEKDRDTLLKAGGKPFVVMGRPMGAFVVVPQNFRDKPAELKKWLARSIAFAATRPAKVKRKKTRKEK